MRVFALALALAFALAVPAAAHSTVQEDTESAAVGPYFLYFSTSPSIVYASEPYLATVSVTHRDFQPAGDLEVRAVSEGFAFGFREGSKGTYTASLETATPGKRNVTLEIPSSNGTVRWNVSVAVYPDLGVEIQPANATDDAFVGSPTDVAVLILDRASGAPDTRATDARFRIERWSDDHKTMFGSEEVDARNVEGAWVVTTTFEEVGMRHVRVASESLGMGFEDAPYIHLYVLPADARPVPPAPKESPLAVVLVLAALALAAAGRR